VRLRAALFAVIALSALPLGASIAGAVLASLADTLMP
jgi:hypothetical protein